MIGNLSCQCPGCLGLVMQEYFIIVIIQVKLSSLLSRCQFCFCYLFFCCCCCCILSTILIHRHIYSNAESIIFYLFYFLSVNVFFRLKKFWSINENIWSFFIYNDEFFVYVIYLCLCVCSNSIL